MTRKPRFNLPGLPQHLAQTGIDRSRCFFEARDYHVYLDFLHEACSRYDCMLHAYVLLPDHVHLLATPVAEHGVSHMMKLLGQRYVRHINRTYGRSGTLWEGRYKSNLVEPGQHLLNCMQYIDCHAVQSGLSTQATDYPWCSYRANSEGLQNPLLTRHEVYLRLGDLHSPAHIAYRKQLRSPLPDDVLQEIRSSLQQELVLGSEPFKTSIEGQTNRQTRAGVRGRPRVLTSEPPI